MKIALRLIKDPLAGGLRLILAAALTLLPVHTQTVPSEINVVVVEGEGATYGPRQRVEPAPAVRVTDGSGQPIEEATAVFTLPTSGASGEFSNGSKNLTVMTDSSGLAAATGIRTNQIGGKLQILVTVSYRGLRARTLLTQYIEVAPGTKPGGGSGKIAIILAIVGAAAAGGVYAATRGGNGNGNGTVNPPTPPPTIGITPGTPTINPPR